MATKMYYTKDGIPLYRKFNGIKYFLLGRRCRTEKTAKKQLKEYRTPEEEGGMTVPGIKYRMVKHPNGKVWLFYTNGQPIDWRNPLVPKEWRN